MSLARIGRLPLGLLIVGLICSCLLRFVPSGNLAVLQNRVGRSDPQLLGPGLHWRIPLWESVETYPRRPVTLQGEVGVVSRDRIKVSLPYELGVELDEEKVLRAHREAGGAGAVDWIRHETEAALRRTAKWADAYQLLRDTLPAAPRATLEKSLARWGLVQGSLKVGPGRVRPEILASFSSQRLRALRKPSTERLVVIGVDGADWDFALPMIRRGELPNLARLRREGAYGKIRTNNPPLSPLLWTTVATGKSPDLHGINDFLVVDLKSGQMRPISSDFRKVKAFWNIATDAGLTSEVVAWWATWPAEPIRGILVSDRVSYSTFSFLEGAKPGGGETFPEGYFQEIQPSLIGEKDIRPGDLSPLVLVTAAELAAARTPEARSGERGEDLESLATLIRVLASTENYRRITLDLLRRKQPDLFAVYFQGIDEINHRYAHLSSPRMTGVSPERFRKYSEAVAGFYRLQDRLLGEILRNISPETTVIVLSDHGFLTGAARPRDVPPFISQQPGLWHAPFGLLVLWGNHVKPGPLPTASLFDILPTILDLLGLPPAKDLPGRSLRSALDPSFLGGSKLPPIASYEAYGDPLRASTENASQGASPDSEAMVETLRSLGYVGPAPVHHPGGEGKGEPRSATTALYHSNLAAILIAKGDLEGGEAEYRKALEGNPDTGPALVGLARIEERKGRPDQALALLRQVVGRGIHHDPETLIRMADLFQRSGRQEDGLIYFENLRSLKREEPLLDTAMGVLYSAMNRPGEAEKALRAALSRNPLSIPAMEELFVFYDRQGKLPELIPDLEAAVRAEEGSFMHHNWLGLAFRRQSNLEGAERELKRAAALAPDQVGPVANLGSLYLQEGRVREAMEVLERALSRDSSSVEGRTNLILALGRVGNLERARELFEEGDQVSPNRTSLLNAMAFASQANGRGQDAVKLLVRSLGLDPTQPQAMELLKKLDPVAAARFSP